MKLRVDPCGCCATEYEVEKTGSWLITPDGLELWQYRGVDYPDMTFWVDPEIGVLRA